MYSSSLGKPFSRPATSSQDLGWGLNRGTAANTNTYSLYAISGVLKVPAPEPATILMMLSAALLGVGLAARQRPAQNTTRNATWQRRASLAMLPVPTPLTGRRTPVMGPETAPAGGAVGVAV
jgi:hypothetical protein